jgi:hypothetical protein
MICSSFEIKILTTESTEGITDWSNNLPQLSADFKLMQNLVFYAVFSVTV